MPDREARLKAARKRYASQLAHDSGVEDPRIERAFATVRREDFVGPGPWMIMDLGAALAGDRYARTPDADPAHLYRNALVALEPAKGINNGEPALHAGWLGAVAPKAGEAVAHVGAGTGYYTAVLARLVRPGGMITAYEIEPALARMAKRNLASCRDVTVIEGNAVALPLPPSDIVYVNAGVAAPPVQWLEALKPEGRMVFPWRPTDDVALAMRVTRKTSGFAVKPLMPSWFIPCVDADRAGPGARLPNRRDADDTRSVWLTRTRWPDVSATAIFDDVWFSSRPLPGD